MFDKSRHNPYQPTTADEELVAEVETVLPIELSGGKTIEFSGTLTPEHIDGFLEMTVKPNGPNWVLWIGFAWLIALIVLNLPWPWALISIGVGLLFVILALFSSKSYHRYLFTESNPHLKHAVVGTIDQRGYQVSDENSQLTALWSSVARAHANESLVAFQSAHHLSVYRIIAREFLADDSQWELLQSIASVFQADEADLRIVHQRHQRTAKADREAERPWIVEVGPDDLRFSGPVRSDDLKLLQNPHAVRRAWLRFWIYFGMAATGVAAIFAGVLGLLIHNRNAEFHPALLFAICLIVNLLLLGLYVFIQLRRRRDFDQIAWHTNGYVNEKGVMFDLGNCSQWLGWTGLCREHESDESVVVRSKSAGGYHLLKANMFDLPSSWQRTKELIALHVEPAKSDK